MQYQKKIQRNQQKDKFSNTHERMCINKLVLVRRPILVALKKMAATQVLLGRCRSLLGTVLIAELGKAMVIGLGWSAGIGEEQ